MQSNRRSHPGYSPGVDLWLSWSRFCFALSSNQVLLTGVSGSHNLLQNFVLECPQQCLHNHVVVCPRCESDQVSGGGCFWQADLRRNTVYESIQNRTQHEWESSSAILLPRTSSHWCLWEDSRTPGRHCSACRASMRSWSEFELQAALLTR